MIHYEILRSFIQRGYPPTRSELDPTALDVPAAEHGVVLHPSGEIWIAHPCWRVPAGDQRY